jgi:hypothetical protein
MSRLARILAPLLLAAAPAIAHRGSESQLDLTVDAERIHGVWRIGLHDLGSAEPGAAELTDLDAARAWLSQRPDLAARLGSRLVLKADEAACPQVAPPVATPEVQGGKLLLVLDLGARCPSAPRKLTVGYRLLFDTDPLHQGLMRLVAGSLLRPAVFTADSPEQVFALREASAWERAGDDLRSGVWHIWTGFDHLLFLLCLLLPAVQVRGAQGRHAMRPVAVDVVRVVTAFTVAHSITLSLAALHVLGLPARFTESAIAASVVLAAAMNLRPMPFVRRWQAAFGFGLVHGFGFASALDEMHLTAGGMLPTLVAFNAGVEVGQLAVVTAVVPLAFALRDRAWYRPVVIRIGSAIVALVALIWFLERAFDVRIMS